MQSSHNTFILGQQLKLALRGNPVDIVYAEAFPIALNLGYRCLELDVFFRAHERLGLGLGLGSNPNPNPSPNPNPKIARRRAPGGRRRRPRSVRPRRRWSACGASATRCGLRSARCAPEP